MSLYLSILMALIPNIEGKYSKLNQTWLLTDYSPKGWYFSNEKVDILKFNKSNHLELISIELGLLKKLAFTITDGTIILESGEKFGSITSLSDDQLIIAQEQERTFSERIYTPLPKSVVTFSDEECLQQVLKHQWHSTQKGPNNKGTINYILGKSKTKHLPKLQLSMQSNRRNITFPAQLKRIEDCLFLSCEIPNIFGDVNGPSLGKEHYIINKLTSNEIQLSISLDNEVETLFFRPY